MTKNSEELKPLPGATTALLFAMLGLASTFLGHLVSLAFVLSLLALVLVAFARWRRSRSAVSYTHGSILRTTWALRIGLLGLFLSTLVWLLWRYGVLPFGVA